MKIILFIFTALIAFLSADGRLVERNTDTTPNTIHVEYTVPTRVARAISEEETVTGYSKEYDHSNELLQNNPKKSRLLYKPRLSVREVVKISRLPRGSGGLSENLKKSTEVPKSQAKTKATLVKKPIPKFNEIDYDDDFQSKVIRSAAKYAESSEHEDEDFNLDDYDFDVNHDEFIGRGKPLEPRQKSKDFQQHKAHIVETDSEPDVTPAKVKPPAPITKLQSKVVIPPKSKIVNKRAHAVVKVTKKAADKMKEDYYDEIVTSTKTPELKPTRSDPDDDTNEENDDSKEYYRKPVRYVRSPWGKNEFRAKIGEKSPGILSDLLTILPMFPQARSNLQFVEKSVPNSGVVDSLLVKPLI